MDRYEFINQQTIKNKGRVYESTLLPVIPKTFNDRYIFTRDGDRLDNLAFEFYGDPGSF
jgi:hypothetical protein